MLKVASGRLNFSCLYRLWPQLSHVLTFGVPSLAGVLYFELLGYGTSGICQRPDVYGHLQEALRTFAVWCSSSPKGQEELQALAELIKQQAFTYEVEHDCHEGWS